jgi:hypothetical protein
VTVMAAAGTIAAAVRQMSSVAKLARSCCIRPWPGDSPGPLRGARFLLSEATA